MRERMSKGSSTHRARARRGWSWTGAILASCAGHALALVVVAGSARPFHPVMAGAVSPQAATVFEEEAFIDLAALDSVRAPAPFLDDQPVLPEQVVDAPAGDQANLLPTAKSPPRAGGLDRRRPAPDSGPGRGRTIEETAWRADSSQLHERLTDGAERYQPSHARTATAASSPQAVTRQPVVGVADSARSTRVPGAPRPAAFGVLEPADPGQGSETVVGAPTFAPPRPASDKSGAPALSAAMGPLDSERGAASFDVPLRGAPRDEQGVRAASAEAHPSLMDLSHAASPGSSAEGHGPSATPGATPRPTLGLAPAPPGQGGVADGPDEATSARERVYARYEQELRARVNRYLAQVWPRALAIRLQQGEAMVSLVVQPDGRLAGPARVMKSAGFAEFDQAALEAVRLATPFPPLPRPGGFPASARPFSLRVIFSNPVIR